MQTMLTNITSFFRKIVFKRRLAKKLESMIWELEANALYDEDICKDVRTVMKETEDRTMKNLAEAEDLEKEHSATARDRKKTVRSEIDALRESMRQLTKQFSIIAESAQSNRAKAADLRTRRTFITTNF